MNPLTLIGFFASCIFYMNVSRLMEQTETIKTLSVYIFAGIAIYQTLSMLILSMQINDVEQRLTKLIVRSNNRIMEEIGELVVEEEEEEEDDDIPLKNNAKNSLSDIGKKIIQGYSDQVSDENDKKIIGKIGDVFGECIDGLMNGTTSVPTLINKMTQVCTSDARFDTCYDDITSDAKSLLEKID